MTREYTDDEISGRSVLSKFRHLKDWVVAQFADVDDTVDAIDDRVTALEEEQDEGIRSISLSPFTETIGNVEYIGVEETHTNPSGGTGSSNVVLMSRDPDTDRNDCGLTADAIHTLVAGAGGGSSVVQTMAARRSYAEGFSNRNADYVSIGQLAKTPRHFKADGSSSQQEYYGVPICSIDENAIVLGANIILMSDTYSSSYKPSGSVLTPRYNIHPYSFFDTATQQAWGLVEGKAYLVVECSVDVGDEPSINDIFVGATNPYMTILECDDFTYGRVYREPPSYHSDKLIGMSATFTSTNNSMWAGYSGQRGIPVVINANAIDDNSNRIECYVKTYYDDGHFTVGEIIPLAGEFTDQSQYTVEVDWTSLY